MTQNQGIVHVWKFNYFSQLLWDCFNTYSGKLKLMTMSQSHFKKLNGFREVFVEKI